mgnify:CR=1 FL=1
MLLPDYQAYIFLLFMKIFLSIIGGIFLGKTILKEEYFKHSDIVILCSFIYGILPNDPEFLLGFAGLPIVMALLIRLYRESHWYLYVSIFLTAFISELAFFGMFECGYILLFFIMDWVISRKPKYRLLGGLCALSLGLMIAEYRLFYTVFFGKELLRNNMTVQLLSFREAVKQSLTGFFHGHYHSADSHWYVVLPVCSIYFIFTLITLKKHKTQFKTILCLLLWIAFNAVLFGFDHWLPLLTLKNMIPGLKGCSLARTLWFNGFLWYFMFCIVLINIKRYKKTLCVLALLTVCFVPQTYNHIWLNFMYHLPVKDAVKQFLLYGERPKLAELVRRKSNDLSYKEFYSQELFEKIKRAINYDGEWSIAYGMHPAILYYNKIATLDGYHSYYTQEYKEQFRKLIAPDLEIDERNRFYYDTWGGRAYIFSTECSYAPVREYETEAANMFIDANVFKEMGGKYIFSRTRITNYEDLGITCIGKFSDNSSPYLIYVYQS